MSSRMHTPHTTCPSCHEEVFLDELVGGRCPLCGYSLDDDDGVCGEYEDSLERADLSWMIFNYFLFKRFDSMGASPLQTMQLLSRYEEACNCNPVTMGQLQFELEVAMTLLDRLKPKKCSRCGRMFLKGGKKTICGDLTRTEFSPAYICPDC